MKTKSIVLLLVSLCLFAACEKDAGEGGLATIRGKVYGYDYNAAGVLHDSGYVGDVRVFISYGEHTWADDDVRTSYTGEYAFQGLEKGKYTLFVFSECDSCNFNQEYKIQHAEITEADQQLILPDFIIRD